MSQPIYENIPGEIKNVPQWVNWKFIERDGKKTKPPFQTNGMYAKSDDSMTWSTFDAVKEAAPYCEGIGFVLTNDDDIVFLDFDKCRCPAFDNLNKDISGGLNMVLPEVADHVRKLNSYTEVSPSGKGLHVFLKGRLSSGGRKKGIYEIYQTGRYATVTGHVVDGLPQTIEPRQQELESFYNDVFGTLFESKSDPTKEPKTTDNKLSHQETASDDVEKIINTIRNSKSGDRFNQLMNGDWQEIRTVSGNKYASQSEADLALLGILAFYTGRNADLMESIFRQSGLFRDKCDEKHRSDGATYLDISIETATNGCDNVYAPVHRDDLLSRLTDFNKKYAVSLLGSRFVIIDETEDEIEFLRLNDFKQFHQNLKIKITSADGGQKIYVVVDYWLKWEGRRQYDRIEFKPGADITPKYNLWRGFAIHAIKGDWSFMQDHIENNICGGKEKLYRYLYAWLARIYQYPGGERPGVAIVLRGKPGTGKGIFARYAGKPLEKHFVQVFSPSQFANKFNAHLKHCILLFADEAFMSDNKEAAGLLKGMITEPYIMCEPKGIDPYRIDNHINVIAAGNASYIVPAGEAERRFCVIDVSESHIQDSEYFRQLCHQMDNGGTEAMFHDLLALNISGVDLRDFPRSNALFDQQLMSMTPIQQWWFECLRFGTTRSDNFGYDVSVYWPSQILISDLLTSLNVFLDTMNFKNKYSNTLLGREFRKLCPNIKRQRITDDDERGYHYIMPSLDQCRKHFCTLMKFDIPWDDF